jgi:hypothetical protein
MASPQSRQQLKDYCLRALGHPVIEVNVEDSQVEDRIDEALQYFAKWHHDGGMRMYYTYPLTQQDIDRKFIDTTPIDPSILTINRIFHMGFNISTHNIFNIRYQLALNDFYGLRTGQTNLNYYVSTMQYIEMLEQLLDPEKQIRFNRVNNRLFIDATTTDMQAGTFLMIEAYTANNPELATEIYNDNYLKKYTIALIKRQWGVNLSKYEGMPLPGNVTFNGGKIYQEAMEEIAKLEEDVQSKYQLPPDFITG